jgi:hypothetical protein
MPRENDFDNRSCRLLAKLPLAGKYLLAASVFRSWARTGAVRRRFIVRCGWRGDGAFTWSRLLTLRRLCRAFLNSSPVRSDHRPKHQSDRNEHRSEDEQSRIGHISIHIKNSTAF